MEHCQGSKVFVHRPVSSWKHRTEQPLLKTRVFRTLPARNVGLMPRNDQITRQWHLLRRVHDQLGHPGGAYVAD